MTDHLALKGAPKAQKRPANWKAHSLGTIKLYRAIRAPSERIYRALLEAINVNPGVFLNINLLLPF
jgi:hypothetical protein